MGGWIWKCALALVGCFAGAYVGQELVGGAIGAALAGALVAACCYPLFRSLMQRRRQR